MCIRLSWTIAGIYLTKIVVLGPLTAYATKSDFENIHGNRLKCDTDAEHENAQNVACAETSRQK